MSTKSDTAVIEALEPTAVWRFFAGMSAVPRPSKKEERIRAHMRQTAEGLGLKVREDSVGNLLIEAPASPGCENAPTVVLQGHVDMVAEKNSGTQHDFDKDPIRLLIGDDPKTKRRVVTADGTTLGADNGIGVAMALAAATEPDVKHGPVEILCTIDEEMGMTGAKALASDFFKGKRLINLDSEEDNAIYIGCAGGCDTNLTWNLKLSKCQGDCEAARVSVSGLRGGHSGGDVHENRGNANKVLTRTLMRAPAGLRIAEFVGGSKRNAIPREAYAVVRGPKGLVAALKKVAMRVCSEIAAESYEENARIDVEPLADTSIESASAEDSARLLRALMGMPCGVLAMNAKMPDLVQTSNNIGVITCERAGDTLRIHVSALSRSSSMSRLHETRDQLRAIGELAGATVQSGNEYPGWEPNPDSPTLATCRKVYKDLFGAEPHVAAIHAGLECGIINERMGNTLDTVSFGPTITGAHSPDEQVYIDSVAKSWKFLKAVLAELAKS